MFAKPKIKRKDDPRELFHLMTPMKVNMKRKRVLDKSRETADAENGRIFDWESLPDSVCLQVFSYMNFCDLILNISHVCTKFRRLVYDRYLWKDLCLLNSKLDTNSIEKNSDCQALIKHLHQVSNFVKTVDLRYCGPITSTILSTLSNQCLVNLQSISLEGCTHVTDNTLSRIAQVCTSLTDVNLLFTSVTAGSLIEILKNNRKLESLVCHSVCLSLKVLSVLASFCPVLRVLHGAEDDIATAELASDDNNNPSKLTNDMFLQITRLKQLRVLILKYTSVSIHDTYFSILGKSCSYLECVEISYLGLGSSLTDIGISNACYHLSELQYLHLYEYVRVTNTSLKVLAYSCPLLKSISFENGFFDDEGILTLVQSCHGLESLSIGVADNSTKDITDKSAMAIAKFCGSNLFHLHMIGWDISDSGLLVLSKQLTNLKHLSVESCMHITNSGFVRALQFMNGLISIDLSFTDIFYDNFNPTSVTFPSSLRKLRLCGLGLAESEISSLRKMLCDCDVREY